MWLCAISIAGAFGTGNGAVTPFALGIAFTAFGQPFLLDIPPALASRWFGTGGETYQKQT
jgi:hypothetical protein